MGVCLGYTEECHGRENVLRGTKAGRYVRRQACIRLDNNPLCNEDPDGIEGCINSVYRWDGWRIRYGMGEWVSGYDG